MAHCSRASDIGGDPFAFGLGVHGDDGADAGQLGVGGLLMGGAPRLVGPRVDPLGATVDDAPVPRHRSEMVGPVRAHAIILAVGRVFDT
jgi:hypothetical protein